MLNGLGKAVRFCIRVRAVTPTGWRWDLLKCSFRSRSVTGKFDKVFPSDAMGLQNQADGRPCGVSSQGGAT